MTDWTEYWKVFHGVWEHRQTNWPVSQARLGPRIRVKKHKAQWFLHYLIHGSMIFPFLFASVHMGVCQFPLNTCALKIIHLCRGGKSEPIKRAQTPIGTSGIPDRKPMYIVHRATFINVIANVIY